MGISLELKKSSRQSNNNSKPVQNRPDPLYCSNPRSEFSKEAVKSSPAIHYRRSNKSHDVEDSELVKHMTNLPGYLKRVERSENSQDKVLNVGVLDWSRLEQWRYTQRNVLEKGSTSSGSCNSVLRKSSGSSRSSSLVHPSRPSGQHSSKSTVPELKSVSQSFKPIPRVIPEKEKTKSIDQKMVLEMEQAPTKYKSFGTSTFPKEDSSSGHGVTKTKNVDQNLCSEAEAGCNDPLGSMEKKIAKSIRTRSRVQDSKQPEIDQSFTEQGKRIVLLRPKELVDKPITPARKCSFSEDANSKTTDRRTELQSTRKDLCPGREYTIKSRSDNNNMPQHSRVIDPVEILNREDSELTGGNSRNPSPLRRFSFSLGRMGRSLSFKEGTAIPQLSSTHVSVKSGPANFDLSSSVDNPNKEKAQCHNRARSSPLRRLLDPLLKHKEANPQQPHDSDHRLPPKVVPKNPDEKLPEHRVQALLQLKLNNGIPLFKFVVDNNSNILAATMKSLGSSDKDDSGRSYMFYLVNEIKKKGWMSQASKAKNCGYAYNVVAQMKVSDSDSPEILRESVLFGVERKQVCQGSPELVPNREIAAAVVRPHGKYLGDESIDKLCFRESQCLDCVTVVLPSGVHSNPSKGEPSPLISRWRSGGSCDCGGWDVGCKVRVLSDESKCGKGSKGFKDGRILDSFELFVQGEEQNGPIFSLVPSKDGIYSVDYSSSISRLQAFFVCVAILSGQRLPRVSSVENILEPKPFDQEDMRVDDRNLRAKLPVKYAPIPPLSPFGRV